MIPSSEEWGDKGERRHKLTPDADIKELLKALKKYKINCTIINESPDPLGDTLKTKGILKYSKITAILLILLSVIALIWKKSSKMTEKIRDLMMAYAERQKPDTTDKKEGNKKKDKMGL